MSTPPPLPPPIPVQPLAYDPAAPTRPGILSAIAILSIVLGSLGILTSGVSTLYGVGFAIAASVRGPTYRSSSTVVTSTPSTPGASDADDETPAASAPDADHGMTSPADRQKVIDGLASVRNGQLSDVRRQHLDALLAQTGRKILPMTGDALTPKVVAANCTQSGRRPPSDNDADYFVFARGRVEVDDRQATFFPPGQAQPVQASASGAPATPTAEPAAPATEPAEEIEVVTPTPTPAGTGPSTQPAVIAPLNDAQVQQVIAAVNARLPKPLPRSITRTLRAQLKSPSQSLFTPATGTALTSQITSANYVNNTVSVVTQYGYLTIGNGTVATGSFGGATSAFGAFPNVMRQAVLVAIGSAVSLALAIYLLVIGILAVRNSPATRRLHLFYAWIKLPLSIAVGLGWWWMASAFFRGFATAATPVFISPATWLLTIPTFFSLLYPLFLLITLNTPRVKAYYAPAT